MCGMRSWCCLLSRLAVAHAFDIHTLAKNSPAAWTTDSNRTEAENGRRRHRFVYSRGKRVKKRERERALSGRATCEVKWTWLLKLKGERRIRTPQIREKTPARRKKKTRSSRRRRGEAKARTRRRRRTGANRGEAKLLQFARFCVVVPAFVLDLDNVAKFCERSLSLSAMCVRVYI